MNRYCIHCMSIIGENEMVCPKCGNSQQIDIPGHVLYPGILLNNRYIVGKVLGEGGFGITYIGRDTNLDRIVAIKEYYPTGYVNRSNTTSLQVISNTQDKESFDYGCDKFLSEARMLAKFSNEDGIVSVIDFFKENGTAYIIMEYLDGFTLKDYLDQKGRLTVEETMLILTPIITSLQKIHQQGLIHRDISPSNIMIANGKIKLIDFGSARNYSNNNKSLSLMLKPGFAPEEQYRSKGVQGPWTDVYALCATIYLCITGIIPEEANDRTYNDELKTPSSIHIHISTQFENALMKGLAVYSDDRYQSIKELLDGLNGISTNNYEEKPTYVPQYSGQEGGLSFVKREDDKATTIVNNNETVNEENAINEKQKGNSEIITPPVNTEKTKRHHFVPIIIGLSLFAVLILTGVILAASGVFNGNDDANENNTNTDSKININTSENEISEEQKSLSAINISFDTNGSTTISDAVVDYGDTFGNLPVPEKDGYIFKGWSYVNVNQYSTQFLHNTNIYFLAPEDWGDSPIVYCHLWNSQAEDPLYPWQSEKQKCKLISDRIYKYTIPAGANVDCVLFSSSEGYQTYDVAIGTICENDLLYCVRQIPNSDFLFEGAWSINQELGPIPSTWFEDVSLINPIIDLDKIVVNDYNYVNSDSKVVCPEDHTLYAIWEKDNEVALPGDLGDNLYDYKIMIDKDVYTLPMKYSDFIDKGWQISPVQESSVTDNMIIEPGKTIGMSINYTESVPAHITIKNYSKVSKSIRDCYIYRLYISGYKYDIDVELPTGIKRGVSTTSDIINAYGEPKDKSDGLIYRDSSNSFAQFRTTYPDKLDGIIMYNDTIPDGLDNSESENSQKEEQNDNRPELPSELSNNLFDYQIMIGNDVYSLPMKCSDLIDCGWQPDVYFDKNSILNANSDSYSESFYKDNYCLWVSFHNYSKVNKVITDCYAYSFRVVLDYNDKEDTVIMLPKGITLGESSLEDIQSAYGEASETDYYSSTGLTTLEYLENKSNVYAVVEMKVKKQTNLLVEISIRNNATPDGFIDYDTPTTVPIEVTNYVVPKELGTDPKSGVVEFYGDLYKLPAPLSAFLNNGWTIQESEQDYLSADSEQHVTIVRNNDEERLKLINHSHDSVQLKYGFVEFLDCVYISPIINAFSDNNQDSTETKSDIKLPKNIYLKMKNAELIQVLKGIDYIRVSSAYSTCYFIPIEKFSEEEKNTISYSFINLNFPEEYKDLKKYVAIFVNNSERYVDEIEVNFRDGVY